MFHELVSQDETINFPHSNWHDLITLKTKNFQLQTGYQFLSELIALSCTWRTLVVRLCGAVYISEAAY